MKLRQLGYWAVIISLSLPAWAGQQRPSVISGYVRDASGKPQIGAVVEIMGSAAQVLTVFTDSEGLYTASELLPGIYTVKVSVPSFLPALREKVNLRAGTHIFVDMTLRTLFDGMRVRPLRGNSGDDDWKWTLRSAANRPVLRIFDDPSTSAEQQTDHSTKASVSFVAGSAAEGYGSGSDMSTAFSVEHSLFTDGTVGFSGNVGYGDSLPSAVVRAQYTHHLADGSIPSLAITMRRFAPTDPALHFAALQALALNAEDDLSIGDVLELKFGSEMQAIQFLGHVTAFRPYGSLDLHTSPNTVVEYAYTTSLPNSRMEKGFDSSPDDLSEADPRVSMVDFTTRVESAHHQEVSISHRMHNTNVQVAGFSDRVVNTALLGTGEVTAVGGFLLPDLNSGTFNYAGNNLETHGLRVVLQQKFGSDLSATLDFAFGGALDLTRPDADIQEARQWITTERHHALAAKLTASVPRSHTRMIASYRWTNGTPLTPVDMFNASPGEADPYLTLFIRQPIPTLGFLPAHMEGIIDVRNLLAQGYVPVVGQDGQTVYLVQAARSVRGGVAITF